MSRKHPRSRAERWEMNQGRIHCQDPVFDAKLKRARRRCLDEMDKALGNLLFGPLDDTERYRDDPDDPGPEEGWEAPEFASNRRAPIADGAPF